MAGLFAMIDIAWFVAGAAVVWLFKDTLLTWWHGAQGMADKLKAQVAALEAKATSIKAAVTPAAASAPAPAATPPSTPPAKP